MGVVVAKLSIRTSVNSKLRIPFQTLKLSLSQNHHALKGYTQTVVLSFLLLGAYIFVASSITTLLILRLLLRAQNSDIFLARIVQLILGAYTQDLFPRNRIVFCHFFGENYAPYIFHTMEAALRTRFSSRPILPTAVLRGSGHA